MFRWGSLVSHCLQDGGLLIPCPEVWGSSESSIVMGNFVISQNVDGSKLGHIRLESSLNLSPSRSISG